MFLEREKSKGIIAGKNLSHVCSPNNIKSYRVIVNESYTDESICKSVHKSINTKKAPYEIDETEDEKPLVTYNLVMNEPSYFNLLECGKKILNNI